MPKLTAGAKTSDLSQQAALMRGNSPWGRLTAAARYFISGVAPDTWMSPNQPVSPVAQEAFGRNKDYPVGYNLYYTPRGQELTSFAQLRALADNCDLVRMAIETRKDQMASLQWSVSHVDPDKDIDDDPRAQRIIDVFKYPDRVQDWDAWLRMLLEDVLVIDAPAILPRKLNNGDHYSFEVIDGALIKPLIDDTGRRPMPPSPAYQQNLKGMPAVDYTADELIYRPRNPRSHKFYGFSPVEQIMLTVNIAVRRSVSQLQYYTEGNIPAMFASVPKEWTPQQIREFQDYWDTVIEGDQSYKRKARFVPGETKVTNLREAPLKDEFDEWLARVVCFAFSLPPTAFVKQMNRSTSETQQDTANKEGLAPLMNWVKRLMDYLVQVHLGCPDLQFKWIEEESIDPKVQMEVLTGYQKQGVYSVNQILAKLGEDPSSNPAANELFIITATGAVKLEQALEPPQPAPTEAGNPATAKDQQDEGDDPTKPKPGAKKPPAKDDKAEKGEHDHLHKFAGAMTEQEKVLKAGFASALDVVREAALKQLGEMKKAAPINTDDRDHARWSDAEGWAAEYVREMDTTGLSLVFDDYTDTIQAVSAQGARQTVAKIVQEDPAVEAAARGAGFDFLDHQDPHAIEWARTHAADMLSSDGAGGKLADATRNMVQETITEAMKSHATNDELAAALREAYAFSEQRAELIARTEVANALGAGGLAGAKAVGMQSKSWLLSNDENKCALCIANAEQGWIAIDKPYVSGALAPGQHPNCQCDQAYRRQAAED